MDKKQKLEQVGKIPIMSSSPKTEQVRQVDQPEKDDKKSIEMSPNLASKIMDMVDDDQKSDILPRPVVLLPLQIEIRHFEKSVPIIPDIAIFDSSTPTYSSIQQIMENVNLPLNIIKKQFKEEIEEEFWIRWYPDEIQYGSPIGKFSAEELLKWSRYKKQWTNCKSEQGEKLEEEKKRIDIEKIREELKDLIRGYSTNVQKEIREIILQETSKGAQKVKDFKKSWEELFGILANDLTKIVENKDVDSVKIAAINRKIDNTFKKIGSKIPSLIETSGNLNNFNVFAPNAQNQLSTNLQNLFQSNLDVNTRKNAFSEFNQGYKVNITGEIINIINQDVETLREFISQPFNIIAGILIFAAFILWLQWGWNKFQYRGEVIYDARTETITLSDMSFTAKSNK